MTTNNAVIITKHYTCQFFKDLSDEDKQKVMEKYHDWFTSGEWWDYIYMEFKESMLEHHIHVDLSKTHFSGFYSQGDGAAFEASLDLDAWLNDVPVTYRKEAAILRKAIDEYIYVNTEIGNRTNHYYNQYGFIEITSWGTYPDEEAQSIILSACEELSDYLNEFCKEKAKELYRTLGTEYDYLISVECFEDAFDYNGDYVFEVGTGKMFHYEGER